VITYDRYQSTLAQSDTAIQRAVDAAFRQLLELIRQGESPRDAIAQALKEFNADTVAGLQERLSAVLESSLGQRAIRD
jgi:hypothetical protein